MIPEAAVEAAKVAYLREFNYDENAEYIARVILEAAAPHMLAQAWESGANAAWERSTPIVNGQNYQWRYSGDPINPYRSGE